MKRKVTFGAFVCRLLLKMLLVVILCDVVAMAISVISVNHLARVVSQAVTLTVSFTLLYLVAFEEGDLDVNRASFGHSNATWARGFGAGAVACIPFFLLSLLLIAAKAGLTPGIDGMILGLYRLIVSPFYAANMTLLPTVLTMVEQSWGNIVLSALLPLLLIVVIGMGYALGFNRFSVTEHLMYKKK